jgi:hypothetical protein
MPHPPGLRGERDARRRDAIGLVARQHDRAGNADLWIGIHDRQKPFYCIGRQHDIAVDEQHVLGTTLERGPDAGIAASREASVAGQGRNPHAPQRSL